MAKRKPQPPCDETMNTPLVPEDEFKRSLDKLLAVSKERSDEQMARFQEENRKRSHRSK